MAETLFPNSDGRDVESQAIREQRGLEIAALCKLTKNGAVWLVPSQSASVKYTVSPDPNEPHCTCADHETRGCKCKHIYAVEFAIKREMSDDGTITETRTITLSETRKTYPQNWPAYNAAQVNEKAKFQILLRDLCATIDEPPHVGRGQPRIPLRDSIFAVTFKVYSTFSGRRFMTDLREARDKGYIKRLPCYNAIFGVFGNEETFGLLRRLIEESARPLKAIESHFSCDSSGFSGCRFDRWFDHKFGDRRILRAWVKAHIMCGAKTNVVTAVEIHEPMSNDYLQLKPMLATTRKQFDVKEVSADLAYSGVDNLQTITDAGAKAPIPFKRNATGASGGLWADLFHYFSFHRAEFLSRYHLRSNVESTFSMLKRKHGDSLRSKTDVAMKNEVLAKLLCHNICCLIQAIYELGVDPVFFPKQIGESPQATG